MIGGGYQRRRQTRARPEGRGLSGAAVQEDDLASHTSSAVHQSLDPRRTALPGVHGFGRWCAQGAGGKREAAACAARRSHHRRPLRLRHAARPRRMRPALAGADWASSSTTIWRGARCCRARSTVALRWDARGWRAPPGSPGCRTGFVYSGRLGGRCPAGGAERHRRPRTAAPPVSTRCACIDARATGARWRPRSAREWPRRRARGRRAGAGHRHRPWAAASSRVRQLQGPRRPQRCDSRSRARFTWWCRNRFDREVRLGIFQNPDKRIISPPPYESAFTLIGTNRCRARTHGDVGAARVDAGRRRPVHAGQPLYCRRPVRATPAVAELQRRPAAARRRYGRPVGRDPRPSERWSSKAALRRGAAADGVAARSPPSAGLLKRRPMPGFAAFGQPAARMDAAFRCPAATSAVDRRGAAADLTSRFRRRAGRATPAMAAARGWHAFLRRASRCCYPVVGWAGWWRQGCNEAELHYLHTHRMGAHCRRRAVAAAPLDLHL